MHFFRPLYAQTLVAMCQRRYFDHTFDRRHYPNRTIACGLCFIWQPSFVRSYSTCCSRHSIYLFSIHYCYALTKSLNHHHRGFLFEGFYQNPYTFTFFCHHTAIYSFSNFTFIISLITRTKPPSTRSFPHPISLEELLN